MAKVPQQYLEERRQGILDAARRVFVEKGYDAATMNDIAVEAEVAAGSIYRYFENKADLIAAAANACVQDDLASWDGDLPPGMTPGQAFYLLGAQVKADFSAPGHRDEAVLRLESYLAASRDESLRDRIVPTLEESVARLASLVRGAQESGEFDASFDPESFARFLHAVGSGIGSLSVAYGDEFDAESIWDQLIHLAVPSFSEAFRALVASSSGTPGHAPD
ncbi:MAG: TetR/AcrR family transcriptional regulator [Chloroflexi bacterium]|nr:TetR/AcrR family transcriptional regulator [Chloroflexota bacterium]